MLYLIELLALAARNLNRYKLRSFLTMLGIVFGIGAVVSMTSVGAGAHSEILAQIRKMGITNILVNTTKPPEGKKADNNEQRSYIYKYGLTFADADYFAAILPGAEQVLKVHRTRKKIFYHNKALDARILGVEPGYFHALNHQLRYGRFLHWPDYPQARRVCVVGSGIFKELAYIGDPLQMSIRIGDNIFQVVGVLAEEITTDKALAEGASLHVYIPFTTSVKRFGTVSIVRKAGSNERSKVELEQIVISCSSIEQVIATASIIATALKSFHEKRDYEIVVPLKQLRQAQKTQQIFRIVMILIAGISLLVGGIGIANIMFATVTERTREIGIRRALGARRRDIMLQFLCETVLIALVGGILGCGLGWLGAYTIQHFTGWQATVHAGAMALTLFISCMVGILSGIAPAHYAARGKPIDSLRHE